MKIPSRNRKVIHEDYYICSHCKSKIYYVELEEEAIENFSETTKIYECPYCGFQDIPNVTREVEYKYSGRCRKKDVR